MTHENIAKTLGFARMARETGDRALAAKRFNAAQVELAYALAAHASRKRPALEPEILYSAKEIEEALSDARYYARTALEKIEAIDKNLEQVRLEFLARDAIAGGLEEVRVNYYPRPYLTDQPHYYTVTLHGIRGVKDPRYLLVRERVRRFFSARLDAERGMKENPDANSFTVEYNNESTNIVVTAYLVSSMDETATCRFVQKGEKEVLVKTPIYELVCEEPAA